MSISGQSEANFSRLQRFATERRTLAKSVAIAAPVFLVLAAVGLPFLTGGNPLAGMTEPGGWFVPRDWTFAQAIMGYSAASLFAAFIPILAGISVYVRSQKANTRLEAAIETYGLEEERQYKIYMRNKPSVLWQQALFPIAVTFLISLYFAYIMIFTQQAIIAASAQGAPMLSTLLLMGADWGPEITDKAARYRIDSYLAMSFAFLGWFVWSIGTIFSRLATLELVAGTYYNMLIRLVMAVVLALVVRHLGPQLFPQGFIPAAIVIGFGIGIFPDAALTWLSKKLRQSLLAETEVRNDLSLDLIQGVSPFRKLRLYELGMDDCQNLAAANPILLFVTSNLSLLEVLDWISQAQLAVIVGEKKFATLQANGLRHAQDFARVCESPAKDFVAKLIEFDPSQLDDLANGLREDPNFKRLISLHERIRKADENADPQGANPVPLRAAPKDTVPWIGALPSDAQTGKRPGE